MKKLIVTLILGSATFASAFAATKAIKVSYFDEGGACDAYCAKQVGTRCSSGCTISYDANGAVTSVTCSYSECGPDTSTRPRIVDELQ